MSQLEPVTLKFKGKEYKVDAEDSIWRLIEVIEDVITFFDLVLSMNKGKIPVARVTRAYTEALNFAGANVTVSEVSAEIGYKENAAMAGALAQIMAMAQPGADIDLGKLKATETQAKQAKKKATGDSSDTGFSSG